MANSERNKIELHSKTVQEVLNQTPHWLLRSGITSMLLLIIVVLIGCWFIKYPDSINAEITITGDKPIVDIIAASSGVIEEILIKNNQKVNKDEVLVIIQNDANYSDIVFLKSNLDSINNSLQSSNAGLIAFPGTILSLGELNPIFIAFKKQYNDYLNFNNFKYYSSQILSINEEMAEKKKSIDNLEAQIKLQNEVYALTNEQYTSDSLLFCSQELSEIDFKKSKENMLSILTGIKEIESEIITSRIDITKLQQSKLDSEKMKLEEQNKQRTALNLSIDNLTAKIQEWEDKFVIKSTVSGIVAYTNYWSTNKVVTAGDTVFKVAPNDITHFIGHIQLPLKNSGKIEIGQKVIIKLENYPYLEYGILEGEINSIAIVPDNNNCYYAELILPSKLITSYGKYLPEMNEFKGTAEIITKDYRLLYRIIQPLNIIVDKE